MKKVVYLVIAFLVVSSVAMAQAPRGAGAEGRNRVDAKTRAERLTERLVKEYSLTDKQKKQVSEANLAWVQQLDSIAQGDNKEREAQREKMKKAREKYDVQLKKILTTEQYNAYTKAQSERQNRAAGGERRTQNRQEQ
ncbi:hypothetical protein EZS27_009248 [termite gut metagenome]|uniref:DUF4890 domain-containing protein n=1 Tax=termite gut metagenome TaxID=433724 RepID=A0A5J4SCG4_9ZZZZ